MFFKSLFGRPLSDDEREAIQSRSTVKTTKKVTASVPSKASSPPPAFSPNLPSDFLGDPEKLLEEMTGGWRGKGIFTGSGLAIGTMPAQSVTQTDRGAEIVIKVPGIDPKGMNIELTNGVVTLNARQEYDEDDAEADRHQHFVSAVVHKIKLPFETDGAGSAATLDGDTVKITVPRSGANQKATRTIALAPR